MDGSGDGLRRERLVHHLITMSFIEDQIIRAADSPSIDAFGRWRVSEPETLFDTKLILDNAPLRWDDAEVSGSGTSSTYNTNQASVTIAVSNLTAGKRVRQSKRRLGYQAGKSQLVLLTAVFGAAAAGITKRVGYFDDSNGLYFEQNSAGLAVGRRTFVTGVAADNLVVQASWNLDKMNGTGASGVTLDPTKSQVMVIDFEWLGVGRVRMGWVIAGRIIYCHEFLNANSLTTVYMSVPNLPVRYSITNDGTGAVASLVQICSTVQSEAGQQDVGLTFGLSRGTTALTTLNDSDLYPLIALRYQTGRNFVPIKILDWTVAITTGATAQIIGCQLLLNPTVAGTALSFTPLANSALEYDISRSNGTKVSAGTVLSASVGVGARVSGGIVMESPADVSLGSTIAGVSDILVLAVQRLTGSTEVFWGAINWREMR